MNECYTCRHLHRRSHRGRHCNQWQPTALRQHCVKCFVFVAAESNAKLCRCHFVFIVVSVAMSPYNNKLPSYISRLGGPAHWGKSLRKLSWWWRCAWLLRLCRRISIVRCYILKLVWAVKTGVMYDIVASFVRVCRKILSFRRCCLLKLNIGGCYSVLSLCQGKINVIIY